MNARMIKLDRMPTSPEDLASMLMTALGKDMGGGSGINPRVNLFDTLRGNDADRNCDGCAHGTFEPKTLNMSDSDKKHYSQIAYNIVSDAIDARDSGFPDHKVLAATLACASMLADVPPALWSKLQDKLIGEINA